MKKHYVYIAYGLLWIWVSMLVLPVYTAGAASAQDLLAAGGIGAVSGQNLFDLLLGLLLGSFLGKTTPTAVPPTGAADSHVPVGAGPPAGVKGARELIGFYAEWWGEDTSSFTALSKHKESIAAIAPFWASLQADGSLKNRGGNDHASVVRYAHDNGSKAFLLINNAKQDSADSPIHTVLTNPALRTKAIAEIEAYLKRYQLDGINIDFEMVSPADRDNLTAFMAELYQRLKPQGYVVSIDVFPKQDENNDVAIAYDYQALAQYADKIILMTYDNHGMWSGPGAIADIRWVEANLQYALTLIPKNKLYIGLAGYGYDWSSAQTSSIEYLALQKVAQEQGAAIQWDDNTKSPHFSYIDQQGQAHQIWFENSRSIAYKLDLVEKYDIAGAALWKLGEEDPVDWDVFKKYQYKK